MMQDINSLIPEQHEGQETETSTTVDAGSEQSAINLFSLAKQKLLSVNQWHTWAGEKFSHFKLVDESGKQLNEKATEGNYIAIDIPGPGTEAGDGYDWVYIESITYDAANAQEEAFVMTVRPASPPHDNETAHFLTEEATSSFVIQRKLNDVTATVFGRNETPNTESSGLIDTIRNAIVGTAGAAGFSKIQWKALTNGLLEK